MYGTSFTTTKTHTNPLDIGLLFIERDPFLGVGFQISCFVGPGEVASASILTRTPVLSAGHRVRRCSRWHLLRLARSTLHARGNELDRLKHVQANPSRVRHYSSSLCKSEHTGRAATCACWKGRASLHIFSVTKTRGSKTSHLYGHMLYLKALAELSPPCSSNVSSQKNRQWWL